MLNTKKTEVTEFGQKPSIWNHLWWPSEAGVCPVPTQKVKNLGFVLDKDLTLILQVNQVTSAFYFLIKVLRKILPFIPFVLRKTVVGALVLSRIDY